MSPWTVLGWVLVGCIVLPIAVRVILALLELAAAVGRDLGQARRLRRAHKGKAQCDYRDCTAIATRRGASGFVCEGHIGTHVTRKHVGMGSTVSFAQLLDHARGDR